LGGARQLLGQSVELPERVGTHQHRGHSSHRTMGGAAPVCRAIRGLASIGLCGPSIEGRARRGQGDEPGVTALLGAPRRPASAPVARGGGGSHVPPMPSRGCRASSRPRLLPAKTWWRAGQSICRPDRPARCRCNCRTATATRGTARLHPQPLALRPETGRIPDWTGQFVKPTIGARERGGGW
jgi:hypothetical protein